MGSNGSESCGASRNLAKVVASGNRATCAADTATGVTGPGEADGAPASGGTSVPQAAARVTTASIVHRAIASVDRRVA
ncbi:hypothetical protein [Streptosporangium subroseum]|uniref:hypothetical protein n=1 Tax=Streptosporangium subroseum TaxID=106412 RepID=UPI003084957D|nr:hypothetical protein OHB15_02615 [Streptosporangium subroseum]